MKQTINWHYISEEGLPKLKNNRAKSFLICYRAELGNTIEINGRKEVFPSGKFIEACTVALIQKKESKDGFAYTPAMKFYWGAEIFENVYAWAEFPSVIPFNE